MAVTDIKVSLRKRGATNFADDGFRMLPVTKIQYVLDLLGPDGKIHPDLIPAWLFAARQSVGQVWLEPTNGIDIDSIFRGDPGFAFGEVPPPIDGGVQGSFVEVVQAGKLINESANSGRYELIGAGNSGVKDFPVTLETGDYILLAKINENDPKYSFAIVDNVYGDATTVNKGIVQLYDGVDSASGVLAATAGAVKTAYDLASIKEPAIGAKGSAFNKDFTSSGGNNGTATTVARGDHVHTGVYEPVISTKNTAFNKNFGTGNSEVARGDHTHSNLDKSESNLGTQIVKKIVVSKGVITELEFQNLASVAVAGGVATTEHVESAISTYDSEMVQPGLGAVRTLAKKGIEFYDTVALADGGNHNAGDIVAVVES